MKYEKELLKIGQGTVLFVCPERETISYRVLKKIYNIERRIFNDLNF